MKEDDEGLLSAFRRFEQHGGNPLFRAEFTPVGRNRSKAAMLRLCGYHVVEKWESECQEEKKTDPALKAFLDDLDMVPPLDPRDAFYGGRQGLSPCTPKPKTERTSNTVMSPSGANSAKGKTPDACYPELPSTVLHLERPLLPH
ncbi:unnamed protein product [Porites evermanni]|uniref:Uncharacterized protein n=1 Tax=Porites evermanni TaxID=104178 RepID=A0ABN8M4C6_9CNID|nr:unnamed protein product [Porites evermanni]